MGNYITETKLEQRLTLDRLDKLCKVTDTDERTALIIEIIAGAEAVVNGYLAAKYTTPVTSNDLVIGWSLSIAEYELYKRGMGGNVPEKIRKSYDDAISQLKDVSKGAMALPSATAPTPASPSGSSIKVTGSEANFDEDKFGSW